MFATLVLASIAPAVAPAQLLAQASPQAMLQWFEGSWRTMERRAPDLFAAGYGSVWVPPPSRADSGNQSVGYDVYDRFDLGRAGAPTLYGTETGLKTTVSAIQRTGGRVYLDLVWNHAGFRDQSTTYNNGSNSFVGDGGYPGLYLPAIGQGDGDFHSSFASGDLDGRLAGLIDINQATNFQFIRNPVVSGNPQNLPGGQWANFPTEANRRFYQNRNRSSDRMLFDPLTGESNIPVWDFTSDTATSGTPVAENALGYMMRNTQWLVQNIGVDGFRLDATKHMPTWVLGYFDRAVYRSINRPLLDGSQQHVFSFGEYFDGNAANVQPTIRKDINPSDPGRIGGNRDALDFTLYYAMQQNLSSNGLQNDWRNLVNNTLDVNDDGLANNGSQGVTMVSSHDKGPPGLQNVAYAYTLMRPGNTIVYFNAREFGEGRSFPATSGRGDALGGLYGTTITTLVDIRARYSQGNYLPRLTTKETFVVERQNSLIAGYSNRTDGGSDAVTVMTGFAPGTPLIELTGNAADSAVDPTNQISELVIVNGDGTANLRIPRNTSSTGTTHNRGYVIYGPSGPQGTFSLMNVASTLGPETATNVATNATARVSSLSVIKANSFEVRLQTNQVNLLGFYRDADADGDNALLKINGGLDVNGNGAVDFTTPDTPVYGFENFVTTKSPLVGGGTGLYAQTIDTTKLPEGVNFIEVRAFRKRNASEPVIFSSWRRSIYVDRLAPNSGVDSFGPVVAGVNENRRAIIRSIDLTANNVHVLLDLPPALTQAQVLARISGSTNASQTDRDLWQRDFSGVTHGNHVLTVVTYEETGTVNVQRFPGLFVSSIFGAGFGDLNFDGQYTVTDIDAFRVAFDSSGAQFNPAGDLDGDGIIDYTDLLLLGPRLMSVNASGPVLSAYNNLFSRGVVPEPGAIGMLALPALALSRRSRTRRVA